MEQEYKASPPLVKLYFPIYLVDHKVSGFENTLLPVMDLLFYTDYYLDKVSS